MSLTVGAVLQNGRYVIQAILEDSPLGITYQANHTFLDQTVIIQSIQENGSTPEQLTKLRQQFLIGVRRFVRGQYPYPGRVLDYFNEAGCPFLVLERLANQTPPKLEDWLPPLDIDQMVSSNGASSIKEPEIKKPEIKEPEIKEPEITELGITEPETKGSETTEPAIADSTSTSKASIHKPESLAESNGKTPVLPAYSPLISASTSAPTQAVEPQQALTPTIAVSHNGSTSKNQSLPLAIATSSATVNGRSPHAKSSKKKANVLLPAALAMTSVIAGLMGAGFGWSLRFEPSGEPRVNGNPIFSREQSFPPTDSWPIQESADYIPPDTVWERSEDVPNFAPVRRRDPINYEPAPVEPAPVEPDEKVISPADADPLKAPPSFNEEAPPEAAPPLVDPSPDLSVPPLDPAPAPVPEVEPQPIPEPVIEQPPAVVPPAPQPSPLL